MQCEVRPNEASARSRAGRTSDTLPKPGRVTEVCKEWLVHEDGALAYKLQKEEVEQHLTGNKSRNAIVREDFPRAREEQRKEEEEAMATTTNQEEADAAVARQLAQRIEQEDEERRRRLEHHDSRVARHIQERELKKNRSNPQPPASTQLVGDVNRVGLPDISDVASAQFRGLSLREEWSPVKQDQDHELTEEEQRRLQELQDEELARLLQEQETRLRGEGVDQLDRDRLMAIEAQDKELAKLLQEREKAKARRARERAKQKALLKKQQEAATGEEAPATLPPSSSSADFVHRHRQRYPDPEAIEVLSPGGPPLPNIAMVIDPTYSPHSTPCPPPSGTSEFEEYDEGPVPPYMPIQGQRRTSSLEKKHKKKQAKDGCKQQ